MTATTRAAMPTILTAGCCQLKRYLPRLAAGRAAVRWGIFTFMATMTRRHSRRRFLDLGSPILRGSWAPLLLFQTCVRWKTLSRRAFAGFCASPRWSSSEDEKALFVRARRPESGLIVKHRKPSVSHSRTSSSVPPGTLSIAFDAPKLLPEGKRFRHGRGNGLCHEEHGSVSEVTPSVKGAATAAPRRKPFVQ
jgi:hypothetical protein